MENPHSTTGCAQVGIDLLTFDLSDMHVDHCLPNVFATLFGIYN